VLGEQLPLEIVHRKVLAPVPSPVIVDVGFVVDVIVPDPLINDHAPVPIEGVFPVSVAVAVQIVWSLPASAAVIEPACVMITSSDEEGHGELEIVHRKVLLPAPRPVTGLEGLPGLVNVPLPATTDHAPVPPEGVLAARVAELIHAVWSVPASAVVGD
jgi:hypothetical protein